jgi:hypothetical protein
MEFFKWKQLELQDKVFQITDNIVG